MSHASELLKRAGPRVRVRAGDPRPSPSGGKSHRLHLSLAGQSPPQDAFAVARLLVAAGVTLQSAKRALDDLVERRPAVVEARHIHDLRALQAGLAEQCVSLRRLESRVVDVKALRARLKLSQEAFALRYGLDVATLRNWEQGRTRPDGPAAVLLQLIDRDPDRVVELLAS